MTSDRDRVAIIGTRTPDEYQAAAAEEAAQEISRMGFIVTTGAAFGIDTKAMLGTAPGSLEIYLPWATYNSHLIPKHASIIVYNPAEHVSWTTSVGRFHPAPKKLSRGAFALHARNYGIVSPTKLVLAMPDAQGEGGTAQGIRIARGLGIPVIEVRKGSMVTPIAARDILAAVRDTLIDPSQRIHLIPPEERVRS